MLRTVRLASLFISSLVNFWERCTHHSEIWVTRARLWTSHMCTHTRRVMNFSQPALHSKTIPTPHTLTRRCQHSLPLAQGCPTPDDVSNLSHHLLLASALPKGGRVQLPLPPPPCEAWPSCVEVWKLWDTIPLEVLVITVCLHDLTLSFLWVFFLIKNYFSIPLHILSPGSLMSCHLNDKQTTHMIDKAIKTGH